MAPLFQVLFSFARFAHSRFPPLKLSLVSPSFAFFFPGANSLHICICFPPSLQEWRCASLLFSHYFAPPLYLESQHFSRVGSIESVSFSLLPSAGRHENCSPLFVELFDFIRSVLSSPHNLRHMTPHQKTFPVLSQLFARTSRKHHASFFLLPRRIRSGCLSSFSDSVPSLCIRQPKILPPPSERSPLCCLSNGPLSRGFFPFFHSTRTSFLERRPLVPVLDRIG